MRLHLTDIAVRSLKVSGRNTTFWDDTTPGFGIRVGKKKKTWTVMRGANRQRITIGHYGEDGMSLSQARAQAKRLLAETPGSPLSQAHANAKRLPAGTPEQKIVRITFEEARTAFIAEKYRDAKASTAKEAARLLNKYFKSLHTRRLPSITDSDIARELHRIEGPSSKLHAFRAVRCFFNWCTRPPRRWVRPNPMEGYQQPGKDRRRSRILTDRELAAVWIASERAPHAIFRVLILWGTRNSETACIRRDWISDGVLTIPGAYTKNSRDHEIPILPLARQVLEFPSSAWTILLHRPLGPQWIYELRGVEQTQA